MAAVESYRQLVVARAGGACEYCRLLQDATGVTFHIDHVIPLSLDGKTVVSNLALSCPGCNLSKSSRISGADDDSVSRRLFNPRAYDPWLLGWHLNFSLERQTGEIVPRTATGVATVTALNMNAPRRASARKLQIKAGLIG